MALNAQNETWQANYTSAATDMGMSLTVKDLPQLSRARTLSVVIAGLSAETIQVFVSNDYGVSWSATGIRPFDCSTGALFASNTLANGTYVFPNWCHTTYKLVKSAGVSTATVNVLARS